MKSILYQASSKLLAKILLTVFVFSLLLQAIVHEEIHHKKNSPNATTLTKQKLDCCTHTGNSEGLIIKHSHLNDAASDCDFCDQLFHQVFFQIVTHQWIALQPSFSPSYLHFIEPKASALLPISRNKSPPFFIS